MQIVRPLRKIKLSEIQYAAPKKLKTEAMITRCAKYSLETTSAFQVEL